MNLVTPSSPSPGSPRAARSRAALIAAGLRLFAERPVDAVSVDEIVAAAGVAKGTFFNHFADKHAFAASLAAEIRLEIERGVDAANAGVADPLARLAGGMRVAAAFALAHRARTLVLLRANDGATGADHPLNAGVSRDLADAAAAGSARPEVEDWGVLYWVGLCQALMIDIVRRKLARKDAAEALAAMALMGLTGLGAFAEAAREAAGRARADLLGDGAG
ncbi:MAG: helix-turn-helix transcriptional regulator [Sphingomonadales bacterium]|nr:helix-turn-helix transcriptional regulator [Sphingomonadales bacterium]MDE2570324.1 helix-turn-helix transcriptional regulator [Sphingomonadales bacterium]